MTQNDINMDELADAGIEEPPVVEEVKADLYTELERDTSSKDRIEVLRDSLLEMFDKVLNDGKVEDTEKLGQLARIRSRIEIDFGKLLAS